MTLKCGISKIIYADDTQIYVSIPKCTSRATVIARIESCLCKIQEWSLQNSLKLNLGKTEVVHVRPRDKLPSSLSITVSDIPILSVSKVRDLGVIVQDDLGMKTHINNMCNRQPWDYTGLERLDIFWIDQPQRSSRTLLYSVT